MKDRYIGRGIWGNKSYERPDGTHYWVDDFGNKHDYLMAGEKKDKDGDDSVDNIDPYSKIFNEGLDKITDTVETTVEDSLFSLPGNILKQIGAFLGSLALITAAGTIGTEMAKNPNDKEGAVKKAARNVGCVVGIILSVIIAFAIQFAIAVSAESSGYNVLYDVAIVIISILELILVIGLIRVICNKTFYIKIRKTPVNPNAKPIPFWIYILIEIVSTWAVYGTVHDKIREFVVYHNSEVFGFGQEHTDKYFMLTSVISFGSLAISLLIGVCVCLIVRYIRRHAKS